MSRISWFGRYGACTGVASPYWVSQSPVSMMTGDYNGDGRDELAVWRPRGNPGYPSNYGVWYILGIGNTQWGLEGDIPVPADYNGDGKTELAVWRSRDNPGYPSNYGVWYILGIGNTQWGLEGDIPVPGDYNGDGKAELAVWRPVNNPGYPSNYGVWYVLGIGNTQWGLSGDIPVPGDYDFQIPLLPAAELAVWRAVDNPGYPSNYAQWYILGVGNTQWGLSEDIPAE